MAENKARKKMDKSDHSRADNVSKGIKAAVVVSAIVAWVGNAIKNAGGVTKLFKKS